MKLFHLNKRNVSDSKLSNSEIISISLVDEAFTVDSENAWFYFVKKKFKDLFPNICDRSRLIFFLLLIIYSFIYNFCYIINHFICHSRINSYPKSIIHYFICIIQISNNPISFTSSSHFIKTRMFDNISCK